MYIWNIKKLAMDLQEDRISSREEMKYLMTFSLFFILITHFLLYPFETIEGAAFTHESIFVFIADMIFIGFLTLWYLFRINQSGDNKDFIKRVMCLGLPIGVRILTVTMFFLFLFGILSIMSEQINLIAENNILGIMFSYVVIAVETLWTGVWLKGITMKNIKQ
jgi:membrane protease YdiL (CAAX protease family)